MIWSSELCLDSFFFCVYVSICRFSVCSYHELLVFSFQMCFHYPAFVLYSWLLDLVSHLGWCLPLPVNFRIIIFLCLVAVFSFPPGEVPLSTGLVALNSLGCCLSVKLLILLQILSNLNKSFAGWSILGCWLFPFITLNVLCHSLLQSFCWEISW